MIKESRVIFYLVPRYTDPLLFRGGIFGVLIASKTRSLSPSTLFLDTHAPSCFEGANFGVLRGVRPVAGLLAG